MLVLHKRFCAPLALVFLLLGTGCSTVQEYDVKIDDLDTELNLFEDGLAVPLGSSNQITVKSLLNSAGESIDDYLKTDASGVLVLTYDGTTSLAEQIEKLDLDNLSKADAIHFSRDFTYHVGDVDPENFSIDEDSFDVTVAFSEVEDVDVELDPVKANIDSSDLKVGMDEYKDVIEGNDDLQLANKIGTPGHEEEVEKSAELQAYIAGVGSDKTVPVKELLPDIVVEPTLIAVKVDPIKLHDDVTAVRNIKTEANAKMVISLSVSHPFISDGEMVPDVDLDFSKLFVLEGGSQINLKELVLNPGNNWSATRTYNVTDLATTEYTGDPVQISIDDNISLAGTVEINEPMTSKATLNTTEPMLFEMAISFTDLTIASADIEVRPVDKTLDDTVTIGNEDTFSVSDDIKDVKTVLTDPSKPIYLKITPANLDRLKGKDIPYTISLDFPKEIEVEGTTDGKLTLTGDLAKGPVNEPIVIKAFHPTVADGAASMNAEVKVHADITAKNIVVASTDLPSSAAEDVSFDVTLEGTPVISDIIIVTNDIEKDTEDSGEMEFEVNGPDSFGAFIITPEGTPSLTIDCNVPEIPNLEVVPDENGILVMLPDVFEFDGSKLTDPNIVFSAADNSLLIKNALPAESIVLPIKHIRVHTEKVDGVSKVVTSYSVTGKLLIPSAEISHNDLKGITGAEFGIVASIPEIKAETLALEDQLSFDFDEQIDLDFDLDTDDLLKRIEEVSLENVYLNLFAGFEGLPKLGEGDQFYVDLLLELPDFITPNKIPVKGSVINDKLVCDPVKIDKLNDIDLYESNKVEGKMIASGTMTADGQSISLSSLQSDVKVTFDATIAGEDGQITLTKATGVFSYDIDEETSIELDDLPEFLKEEGVTPDFDDPQITLDIKTNLGIVMVGDIEIVPIIGGEPQEQSKVAISNVHLPYTASAATTTTKSYIICKSKTTVPTNFEGDILEADVSKLLLRLPDELRIVIKAAVDESVISVVETDAEYVLDIDYAINAPLAFGADFHFSTDTDFDLSDLADYTSLGDFGIKGKAVNTSPLNMTLEMTLLDDQENVIPQKQPCVITIGSGTSNVEFYLTPLDKDAKLTTGRITITVTALPGIALKETDSIQLLDMIAVLPEGITYTLSEE